MKKSEFLMSLFLGLGLLSFTGCGKSTTNASTPKSEINTLDIKPETNKSDTVANHNVKAINLRSIADFAIFAHSSISSTPNSTINGKVGLRPASRSLITLDPSEVKGGQADILAGDDLEIETATYVKQAKLDMINAFNEAEILLPDADKIGLWNGNLSKKVLAAGIYEWNSRVTIPLDLILEGNENDVWIFKIAGQLRVGSDVHVILSGGALAKNVFWQVGDDVLIKARSSMVGTIISQQTFEMKEQASLIGRALVKNDKLILDKNTISLP
ncbi:MAG: ice-binding family protein [Bacteriovorax sp.]|nr:ice-binding family protein [Bacteriovorax sp.]